jgi:hypothetical protein
MAFEIEVTDTFGGEANYCWVRRRVLPMAHYQTRTAERRAIANHVRELAGWPPAIRITIESMGDGYRIVPRGLCQVAFVTWIDGATVAAE